MPNLSFVQLAKVFVAGLLGYWALLAVISIVMALAFPGFIKRVLDLSLDNFPTLPLWLGIAGAAMAPLLFVGAWCVTLVVRRKNA
jgi:hypothetical protein